MSCRSDLVFLVHTASRVLYAIAYRLLAHIQSDVIEIVSEEPPGWFSESASQLSSAFRNASRSSRRTFKQLVSDPILGLLRVAGRQREGWERVGMRAGAKLGHSVPHERNAAAE